MVNGQFFDTIFDTIFDNFLSVIYKELWRVMRDTSKSLQKSTTIIRHCSSKTQAELFLSIPKKTA